MTLPHRLRMMGVPHVQVDVVTDEHFANRVIATREAFLQSLAAYRDPAPASTESPVASGMAPGGPVEAPGCSRPVTSALGVLCGSPMT